MFESYPQSYPRDIQKQWKTLWFSNWVKFKVDGKEGPVLKVIFNIINNKELVRSKIVRDRPP